MTASDSDSDMVLGYIRATSQLHAVFSDLLEKIQHWTYESHPTVLDLWRGPLSFMPGVCVLASSPEASRIRRHAADELRRFNENTITNSELRQAPFMVVVLMLEPRAGAVLPEQLLDTQRRDLVSDKCLSFPVRADIDGDGEEFAAIIGGVRIPLDPRAMPQSIRQDVASWTAKQASERQTMAPSAVIEVMHGARPRDMREADRIEKLRDALNIETVYEPGGIATAIKGYRIRVELDAESRILAANSRPSRRKMTAAQAVLPYDANEGTTDELAEMALQTLAAFDTDAKLTLMAMMSMAERNGNRIIENISDMQRLRGIPNNAGRQRLHRHFDLFTRVQFEVSPTDKPDHYQRIPLLQYDRTIGIRGNGEAKVYRVHEELWDRMQQRGHAIVWDDAVLAANTKDHEWPIRLYWDLAARWSRGWVQHRMDQTGGRIKLSVGAWVQAAGLLDPVLAYRSKHGTPATRRRLRETLELLQRFPGRDGRMARLVGDFDIEERGRDPLDDMLTVTAAPATAHKLTEFRQPAIQAAAKRAELEAAGGSKPATSGRSSKRRQTRRQTRPGG